MALPSALAVGATVAALSGVPAPAPEQAPAFEIAQVTHPIVLRARPHGPAVARVDAWTEFGSHQTLGVVKHRGGWLAVVSTTRPNGELSWIRARDVRLTATRVSLTLDLSRRRLVLRQGDKVLRRMTVGVGRPGSPTPTGRFALTDKLRGGQYGPYYGCCILALSAHQPHLPAGWTGGDRIAIHGTNAASTIGAASSAGCAHARDADLRVLMRRVPLGAPVFIRA
jgi:lipoprotein-anchoring transpeptidase ErfK/SrfK